MTTDRSFDFKRYEAHWRQTWEANRVDEVDVNAARPLMVVPMFPYPSGKLHVGHVRCYTISDVQARYWRRRGYDVMHPVGWDAFGLPAENAAIKTGVHPEDHTRRNIAEMTQQVKEVGISYDWSREVAACDEEYYKWTQWLFIQLYKHGLAYKAKAPVNWCPTCQTALANEQVVGGPAPTQAEPGAETGQCERCGTKVVARHLEQWFFRTTAFANDLLAGLDQLGEWPEHIRVQQRHWIGKNPDGSSHLRDWLVSRQRYWGAPIPMVNCPTCGTVPVPEADLPVKLPRQVDYRPKGEPPLASAPDFVQTTCPQCGGPARREVETMDTFVDSSWYLYRFVSARETGRPFAPEAVARWLPVGIYVGGAEHAVLHLMYVRFVCRALQQMGWLPFAEPVRKLFTLGMVYLNGAKMSKSKGNVVSQDEVVGRYGADTLRLWSMFMAPPAQQVEWATAGIEGCHRFLHRIFQLVDAPNAPAPSDEAERLRHRTIKRVTEAIEQFRYNTAVSALMEFASVVERRPWREGVATILHLVSPFAPFAAEEIWHRWGRRGSIHRAPWPAWDEALLEEATLTVPVQVGG
ncbi:MAG TPA: leucine--tRNA ligase, partial [Symbiobacteriaceae bacterium]|nr:leucine--tRNA ligase [Symbiobacteriaceae bacterium]